MTFNLNLYGDSPAELRALINALADLPGGLTIEHTPSTPHPAQLQSEAVAQPDKPKASAPVKSKKAAQKSAAAEVPASPAQADTAPVSSTTSPEPKADPAVLDKIRDLARSLIAVGKSKEVQKVINSTGARMVSKIPEDSYTAVWEQLCKIKEELDAAD